MWGGLYCLELILTDNWQQMNNQISISDQSYWMALFYVHPEVALNAYPSLQSFCSWGRIPFHPTKEWHKTLSLVPSVLTCRIWTLGLQKLLVLNKESSLLSLAGKSVRGWENKTKSSSKWDKPYEDKRQSELSRFMPAKTKEAFIGLCWMLVLWLCRNTAVCLYRDKMIVCLYLDCAVQDKAPLSTVTFICVRLIMEML